MDATYVAARRAIRRLYSMGICPLVAFLTTGRGGLVQLHYVVADKYEIRAASCLGAVLGPACSIYIVGVRSERY